MSATKSGKKYHRKGCTYLKSVGGSYPLKDAEALGHEACRRYKKLKAYKLYNF